MKSFSELENSIYIDFIKEWVKEYDYETKVIIKKLLESWENRNEETK